MKAFGPFVLVCAVATTALAAWLAMEFRASSTLAGEDASLRRQLSLRNGIDGKNRQSSNGLAHPQRALTDNDGPVNDQAAELIRLRREVEELRQQTNELSVLQADTRATRDAIKDACKAQMTSRNKSRSTPEHSGSGQLEILEAHYGTSQSNTDVTFEMNDRMRGGALKTIAGNYLSGDPRGKNVLSIVYNFGGTVLTNQFDQDKVVVLPPSQ